MKPTKIFNPEGSDAVQDRHIWTGNTTNLMNLNNIKYDWAYGIYKQMRANFWIPERYDITTDITDYKLLTEAERNAFDGFLSYLTFLDSEQVCNLPHLKLPVTAPEIGMCIAEQTSQESLHSHSYQYMIEGIVDKEKRNAIYDFWRTDKILKERCNYIASLYQNYVNNPNKENYYIALVADYLLEGIYFYNGFILFYSFASRNLMRGSADIIRAINKDELSHTRLFQKLIPEAKKELLKGSNVLDDVVYELTDNAVNQETKWTGHITDNSILGITESSTEKYTKYLANLRLKSIGLKPLYDENIENPYKHLEKTADTSNEGNMKANFFESGVTAYNMSSAVDGWEF